ncbi:MAG: HNH endonuclease [Ignavibacteriae bacterium]|nr:HNH endonuclease [Ignavibacteriota bacterium]NOG96445.1 HNH endonuclease [Ignavibacteriota bacterium]
MSKSIEDCKLFTPLILVFEKYILKEKGFELIKLNNREFQNTLKAKNIGYKNFYAHTPAIKTYIEIINLAWEGGRRKAGQIQQNIRFYNKDQEYFQPLYQILEKFIFKGNSQSLLNILYKNPKNFRKLFELNEIYVKKDEFWVKSDRRVCIAIALKAFEIGRRDRLKSIAVSSTNNFPSEIELENDLQIRIEKSKESTSKERKNRLKKANKYPEQIVVESIQYRRNSDVITEVLKRAHGICERCNSPAPFIKAKDNSPYLEVHHIIQLANGGQDTVKNALALCPNCHRELHFGKNTD